MKAPRAVSSRSRHEAGRIALRSSAAALALLGAPTSTWAQDTAQTPASSAETSASSAPEETFGVEEIVVTAQRRSESLQKVPIAVSAVTAGALEASGINRIDALTLAVPSLSVQAAGGYLALHLRGVGSTANGPGFENPVALYVDGVYYANQSIGITQFNNIERIEVLKGPQGTLFGRNATGGLTQILTRDPGQTAMLNGSLAYGNYDTVDAQLYGATPLSSDLAVDLALHYGRNDGYGTNLATGRDVYGTKYDIAARSKMVWTPGAFKFTLIGDYSDRKNSMVALAGRPGSFTVPGFPVPPVPNAWDVNTDAQPLLTIKGGGVSLKAETDLGDVSVSNIIAYRTATFDDFIDYDGSPLPIATVRIRQKDRQFSNELQFSSRSGGPFTWVAGVYYFNARSRAAPITAGFGPTALTNPFFPLGAIQFSGYQDTDAISAYAQGTLKLGEQVGVTAGVRYSHEKRELNARADGILLLPGSPVVPVTPPVVAEKSFSRPTFRLALDYSPTDDILLYASVNTGFKSGGFNVTIPSDPFYKPEKLTAFEVGEKMDLFDRKVRLNSALFYYDYRNIQTQLAENAGSGIINGARARIYGFDGELTIIPSRALQINAGLTLLNARYKDFPRAPIASPTGGFPVTTGDVSGNRLQYAPTLTTTLGATYTADVGAGELVANGVWLHSAHYFHESDNVVREPSYDQFNGSLTYNFGAGRYSLALFGNNLSNTKVRSILLSVPAGPQIQTLQPPRTYGVRAGFRF